MRTFIFITILALLLVATTPLFAQDSLGIRLVGEIGYLEEIERYNFGGYHPAVAIHGDFAYILAQNYGLVILDISDPSNAETLSELEFEGVLSDIRISGDYAYIANYSDGLSIINIANPERPVQVGLLNNPPTRALSITIVDNLLYLGEEEGFMIYNIEDPAEPEMLVWYRFNLEYAQGKDIVVEGDLAYMAIANFLYIMDISDPENPEEISQVEFVDENDQHIGLYCVAKSEEIVYLGTSDGLHVIDATDPENPEEIVHFEDVWNIFEIEIRDNFAYLGYREGFAIFDISDLDNINAIADSRIDRIPEIILIDDFAYVAGGNFTIYDLTNPRSININAMDVYNDYLFTVGAGVDDLFIFDFSDPMNPIETSAINFDDNYSIYDVALKENFAFISTNGLKTIDWSDPENPEEIGYLDGIGSCGPSTLNENQLYVSCYQFIGVELTKGIGSIDISEPGNPELTSFLRLDHNIGRIKDLVIDEPYAYVINQYSSRAPQLFIVDCNEPEAMELVSNFQIGESGLFAQTISVVDTLIFVYFSEFGFRIIDVSNPAEPELIGEHEIPGDGTEAKIINNIAYIAAGDDGLRMYDVSDWENIHEIGYYETRKNAGLVSVNGQYAYVKEDAHIRAYDCTIALAPNSAPEWIEYPAEPIAVDERDTVEFIVTANDFNGDELTLEMVSDELPDSALFVDNGDNSGRFFWVTSFADSGLFRPLFIASDGELADTISVEITVRDVNSVDAANENLPTDFALGSIYPNPFNSTVNINFEVPIRSQMSLGIHDINGRQVAELKNSIVTPGFHNIQWNGKGISSGIYFARLETEEQVFVNKIILMK